MIKLFLNLIEYILIFFKKTVFSRKGLAFILFGSLIINFDKTKINPTYKLILFDLGYFLILCTSFLTSIGLIIFEKIKAHFKFGK